MRRKQFLQYLSIFPFAGLAMKLNAFASLSEEFLSTPAMPVLFLGHALGNKRDLRYGHAASKNHS
jgi:hypothetical protein